MDFESPRLLELLRNPAEDLSIEIKEWLDLRDNVHKAKLAQAIIALANHGGGALLLGYAQQADGAFIPEPLARFPKPMACCAGGRTGSPSRGRDRRAGQYTSGVGR